LLFTKCVLFFSSQKSGVYKLIAKSHRWQKTAMAAAVAALFSLCGSNAAALSLGRITVQSALGEPLRAEIEVPSINAEEAASLKAAVALPEAFRSAGLDYNPAMAGMQVSLQRRADGRAYIRLNSDRAINDPFVDMIIEASWATGRIVRDYTMLFDPPSLKQALPATPTPAQTPATVTRTVVPGTTTLTPTAPTPRPAEPAKAAPKQVPRPAPQKSASSDSEQQITVKQGDTASKIAKAVKPANVSLDQMLVALLRANPNAFSGDNVNRIRAGAVMHLPTAEQAQATPAEEATQVIVAQSKDFNEFRRKLASSTPTSQVDNAKREASGSIQTKVEDKKTESATPDKLTLSKGALQGQTTEDHLTKERMAKETAMRTAEIAKNINDLTKLGAASSAASPQSSSAAVAASAPSPALIAAAPAMPEPVTSMPSASSAAPAAPIASAPKPVASAPAKQPTPVAVPEPEPELIDELLSNPMLPAAAGGLIALLAGFGFYRSRQRKKTSQVDSSFLESRLQPDSFFGASGGQSVDTAESAATGSSMLYSPSQLDAVDDVDPVAEADVYLAYGRDLQAEEILKDALRNNPERVAIHQKLLEILAKRRDLKGFEDVATKAFSLTNGESADWNRICDMGLGIDPGNSLYQPGGQPRLPEDPAAPIREPLDEMTIPVDRGTEQSSTATESLPSEDAVDLDLDLDFSLDDEPASAISETTATPAEPDLPSLDLDFDLPTQTIQAYEPPEPLEAAANAIEFTLDDMTPPVEEFSALEPDPEAFKQQAATSFGTTSPAPLDISDEADAAPDQDLSMLDFDMGSLSLDLDMEPAAPSAVASPAAADPDEDPLATKLALAEEFSAIGDDDGARALIEEVIEEATGEMKIKAQRALSHL
jgi:pilus assembly protein FimV